MRALPLVAVIAVWSGLVVGRGQPAPAEVRGLWVVRTSLSSPASVAQVVRDAKQTGFNTLLVQVRGRGDAYYASAIEPRAAALAKQPPDFDPLREVITAARAAGLKVHAWVSVNLIASAHELPASPDHVVNRHPDWLMVPRALAQDLRSVDPASPAYVGKIARWTRAQPDVEGIFVSSAHPMAAAHTAAVIADLARRYDVDGIHLDYVRYPSADFDYSRETLDQFRASVVPDLAPAERDRLDRRLPIDAMAYTDMFPIRWAAFRRSRLTSLVMRVRTAVRAARTDAVLSAAVHPDAQEAFDRRLQDWRLWAENRLVDVVCPMAYTTDAEVFSAQVQEASRIAPPGALWAGIGAYRLPAAQVAANIGVVRKAGAAGFVLFSYESLGESQGSAADYLGEVGRSAFADLLPGATTR
jgi:uncharacterized lipoprotein YddW (UPF0748 family)